jgi:hypothetical protein
VPGDAALTADAEEHAPGRDGTRGLPAREVGQGGHGRDWAARGATVMAPDLAADQGASTMTKHVCRCLSDPVQSAHDG